MNRHLSEQLHQRPDWRLREPFAVAIVAALAMMVVCGGLLVHKFREPSGGPVTLKLASGTDGGTYNVLSLRLSRILNRRLKDVRFETLPTQGGLQNLITLVDGEAQIGFVQGPRLAAFAREHPAMAKEIAVIARVYPACVQVVVSKRFQERLRGASKTPAQEGVLCISPRKGRFQSTTRSWLSVRRTSWIASLCRWARSSVSSCAMAPSMWVLG
jgi:hypothetical protein